jgi:hypothetical protein
VAVRVFYDRSEHDGPSTTIGRSTDRTGWHGRRGRAVDEERSTRRRQHMPIARPAAAAGARRPGRRTPSGRGRAAGALLALALLVAGCGGKGGGQAPSATPQEGFSVFVASYDIATSQQPRRFIAGLQALDERLVNYGTVTMRFAWLGETAPKQASAAPSITATGRYLPIPGVEPVETDKPRLTTPSDARGVYAADVAFDRPGYWGVEVVADIEGQGPRRGTASFQVAAKPLVPDVGQQALATRNLTIGAKGVPPVAIDSRAQGKDAKIPDPDLHRTTIAAALAAKRPAVVVFSTPVYCVSQFCGPVTDMVDGLRTTYGGRADFIHVEIWKNFQKQELNDAAKAWLYRADNLNEPWVFVIGADGRIVARFDNVTTRPELEQVLKGLPESTG